MTPKKMMFNHPRSSWSIAESLWSVNINIYDISNSAKYIRLKNWNLKPRNKQKEVTEKNSWIFYETVSFHKITIGERQRLEQHEILKSVKYFILLQLDDNQHIWTMFWVECIGRDQHRWYHSTFSYFSLLFWFSFLFWIFYRGGDEPKVHLML